jgi:hypothetical protein
MSVRRSSGQMPRSCRTRRSGRSIWRAVSQSASFPFVNQGRNRPTLFEALSRSRCFPGASSLYSAWFCFQKRILWMESSGDRWAHPTAHTWDAWKGNFARPRVKKCLVGDGVTTATRIALRRMRWPVRFGKECRWGGGKGGGGEGLRNLRLAAGRLVRWELAEWIRRRSAGTLGSSGRGGAPVAGSAERSWS